MKVINEAKQKLENVSIVHHFHIPQMEIDFLSSPYNRCEISIDFVPGSICHLFDFVSVQSRKWKNFFNFLHLCAVQQANKIFLS